ncbi:MAG: hypothetical protein AAGI06_17615 [Pseudomonadota bacterium]
MSIQNPEAGDRSEFNFTTASTRRHLIMVAVTCAMLWAVIAATIAV